MQQEEAPHDTNDIYDTCDDFNATIKDSILKMS